MAKVFKALKKKAQATPLVGVILDSLKSENPRQNAPSIQAVLDNLQPKQLLINPDFQINQRGQSEYNFAKNGTYGLDCWQHRQGEYLGALVVTPIKGGGVHIKLGANSGGGLRQILNGDDFKIGQPYTAVVSINNTQYKGTLNLSNVAQKFIENELFQLEIGIIEGNFNYSLWVRQTGFEGDINYCNLWEGDIAYPHVKEDKDIAMMRCLKHFERIRMFRCIGYVSSTSQAYFEMILTYKIKSDYTINFSGNFQLDMDNGVSNEIGEGRIYSISGDFSRFGFYVDLKKPTDTGYQFKLGSPVRIVPLTDAYVDVSCEPL